MPQKLYEDVIKCIDNLAAIEWNKKSNSAYASPAVFVCNEDGSLRLCIDYCKLLDNLDVQDVRQFRVAIAVLYP